MWAEAMASKADGGFANLTKHDMKDLLELVDPDISVSRFENKSNMAEGLYKAIVIMSKENAKYKNEVDKLLHDLHLVQDNL